MTRRYFPRLPARFAAILLALSMSGCKDARVRALAGTYVKEQNEVNDAGVVVLHSRDALTLRDDNHWTSASELTMSGEDMLAGGRVGDEIVPPSHVDSGTFALNGVILSVNSARNGVTRYTVNGDTLWIRAGAAAARAMAVTGIQVKPGEGFLVRQR
ncbi:MAG TPA: hypothetical protein VJ865_13275 [Gemmatimonadaceae bacterium]|nr:hypothetical protein [Gemmatimonadaceae bacterium]